jgi:hypothetical protein
MAELKKVESKKIKVKFNTHTAIVKNQDEISIYNNDSKLRENRIFNIDAYQPVQMGEIVEITEEQYKRQFEGKTVKVSSAKFGNLTEQKTVILEQFADDTAMHSKINNEFVINRLMPICEIVQ